MSYEKDKKKFSDNNNSIVENKSNSVDINADEFQKYDEKILKKLNSYLSRTNCTEKDLSEIYDSYNIIADNNGNDFNVDGLSKIEEFVDNSNDKALYNISYIKEFMSDLASNYSDNLPGWGTENESKELEKDVEESEDLETEEESEDLEDEDIEESMERTNKKKNEPSKITVFFKKLFSKKKDYELEDEEIEEVTERKKFSFKSLFSKKNKKEKVETIRKTVTSEKDFESLSLNEKLFKYLEGVTYNWKDLANIVNKISVISENEEKIEELHKFFNKSQKLDNDKKIIELVNRIIELSNPVTNTKDKGIINPKSEVIKKFFNENELDTIPELVSLYNEIVMNDKNIDKLYDYIANNVEEAKNADNIIDKMNEILGKEVRISTEEKAKYKEVEESTEEKAKYKEVEESTEEKANDKKVEESTEEKAKDKKVKVSATENLNKIEKILQEIESLKEENKSKKIKEKKDLIENQKKSRKQLKEDIKEEIENIKQSKEVIKNQIKNKINDILEEIDKVTKPDYKLDGEFEISDRAKKELVIEYKNKIEELNKQQKQKLNSCDEKIKDLEKQMKDIEEKSDNNQKIYLEKLNNIKSELKDIEENGKYSKEYDERIKKLYEEIIKIKTTKYVNEVGREVSLEEQARIEKAEEISKSKKVNCDKLSQINAKIVSTLEYQNSVNIAFNEAWYGNMGKPVDEELLKNRMHLKNELENIKLKLQSLKKQKEQIILENSIIDKKMI